MKQATKCLVLAILFLGLLAGAAFAGDLNAPAAPTDAGSAMFTLEDLYNRLLSGLEGTRRSGAFAEPSAAPGSTMHNLNDIMSKAPAIDAAGAAPDEVLSGKKYWGLTSGQWGLQTGNMPAGTLSATSKDVKGGFIATTTLDTVDADLVSGNIKTGATIFGVAGKTEVVDTTSGDAVATDLRSGKKAYVDGAEVTGTVSAGAANTNGADGAKVVTIPAGIYAGTETTTAADTNLVAGNIKSGVTIFGVAGTSLPTSIPKTGQTSDGGSAFSDGALQKGVAWPTPRFTDNGNGTVTDNLTGLIWTKNANIFGTKDWATALTDCATLADGAGDLSDGSIAGDWRLPNVQELHSLINYERFDPALPLGHPFTAFQTNLYYWSSTIYMAGGGRWGMDLRYGSVVSLSLGNSYYVWPVRGGQ